MKKLLLLIPVLLLFACNKHERKLNEALSIIQESPWTDSEGRTVRVRYDEIRIDIRVTNQDTLIWNLDFLNDYVVIMKLAHGKDFPNDPTKAHRDEWRYFYYIEGDNDILRFEAQEEGCPHPNFLLTR